MAATDGEAGVQAQAQQEQEQEQEQEQQEQEQQPRRSRFGPRISRCVPVGLCMCRSVVGVWMRVRRRAEG